MAMDFVSQDTWRVFRIMAEFVEGFEEMNNVGPAVSIFGSARSRPENPFYQAAEKTAALLAKSGFAIITGGGPGIMEAGNKGAYEAGGESIGLNISLPEEQEGNRYQTRSMDFHYFYVRKVMFVKYASAFICFPGGYGTLDEFFELITLIQTLKVKAFPVILYGSDYWSGLIQWLRQTLVDRFVDAEDLDIFRLVDSPEQAVRLVKQGIKKHWWRPVDAELGKIINGNGGRRAPISARSATTGEGTRYGRRAVRITGSVAKSGRKPSE